MPPLPERRWRPTRSAAGGIAKAATGNAVPGAAKAAGEAVPRPRRGTPAPPPGRGRAATRAAGGIAKGAAKGAVAGGVVGAAGGAAKAAGKAVLKSRRGRQVILALVAIQLVPMLLVGGMLAMEVYSLSGIQGQQSANAFGAAKAGAQLTSTQVQAYMTAQRSTQIPWEIPAAIVYYETGPGAGLGGQQGSCSGGLGGSSGSSGSSTVPLGCPPTAGSAPLAGTSPATGASGASGASGTSGASGSPPVGTSARYTGRSEPGVSLAASVTPTKKTVPPKKSKKSVPSTTTTTVPPIVYLGPMKIRRRDIPVSERANAASLAWSAQWVDARIAQALTDNQNWSWNYNLADGVIFSSDGPPVLETGSSSGKLVASAMPAAIGQLPLKGMDSTFATNVFELAQDWFVGNSPANSGYSSGLGVVCGALQGSHLSVPAPGGSFATLGAQQLSNAAEVVAETKAVGMPTAAAVIAIMTGLTESTLFNLPNSSVPGSESFAGVQWGAYSPSNPPSNGTSVGVFQQQNNWGSIARRMTISRATKTFLGHSSLANPPPGLAQISGWASLPPGVAAQDVQVSAFPTRYAAWQAGADKIVGAVEGISCTSGSTTASASSSKIVVAAKSQLGVPYVWGGGNASGPTGSATAPPGDVGKPGFDCSGLVLYALAQVGITVPHYSGVGGQWSVVRQAGHYTTNPTSLQPGDLVFFTGTDGTTTNPGHVGIVVGPYEMIDAPTTGQTVSYASFAPGSGFASSFVGGGPA